jgi:glycine cleavage system regulatory protein
LELDRVLRAERIGDFAVSAPTRGVAEDPASPERVTFSAPGGSRLTTEHESVVAVLRAAGESWPAAVRVRDALGADASREDLDTVGEALLRSYAANLVQLHVHVPRLTTQVSERPQVSPLARLQVRDRIEIANLRHATIPVPDELDRRLLAALDGTRDRAALLAELPELGAERLEAALALFARSSLLIA